VFTRTIFWLGIVTVISLTCLVASGTVARQWLLVFLLMSVAISLVMAARSISLLRAVVSAAINTSENAGE
jgi:hypothetical protein